MKHIKEFFEFVNESKIRKGSDIVKIMSNPQEWGADMKNRVFTKDKNFIFADTFFYNEKEALDKLIKSWSPGGHYYDYFKDEYGIEIEIIATFSDFKAKGKFKKLTDDGVVYLELGIKQINESTLNEEEMLISDKDIIDLWEDIYGENFINEYPAIWKILKQRPPVDKKEFKRIWSEVYDEDLEKEYEEFWKKIKS